MVVDVDMSLKMARFLLFPFDVNCCGKINMEYKMNMGINIYLCMRENRKEGIDTCVLIISKIC